MPRASAHWSICLRAESMEGLVELTMRMVDYFTVHDEKIVMTRKVLAIEQFRDERAKALASRHFLTGLTEMFTPVFAAMMEKGLLLSSMSCGTTRPL